MNAQPLTIRDADGSTVTVVVRPMVQNDFNLVINSWCRQVRKLGRFARMDRDAFRAYARGTLTGILLRSSTLIAHPDDDSDLIMGVAVYDAASEPTLHYLYTRRLFRRHGIASHLMRVAFGDALGSCPIRLSHRLPYYKHYVSKWGIVLDEKL